MWQYGLPVAYALFVWWFSTGLIVYLDGLPQRTFRWSLLGATVVMFAAIGGLVWSSHDTSVSGAYCGFTCGLLVWGWLEMAFLMGPLVGPRTTPCPDGARGWRRVGYAIQTILYHELAIIAGAVAVVGVTWGSPNQVGAWTFMVLWAMRQSAKLNLFLGVPNLAEEFLPKHLAFLESYLMRRSMNMLFPFSIMLSTVMLVVLVQRAGADSASAFDMAGNTFVASLLALAILEHWFLVVPLPATALWRWSLRSHETAPQAVAAAKHAHSSRNADSRAREPGMPGSSVCQPPIPALSASP